MLSKCVDWAVSSRLLVSIALVIFCLLCLMSLPKLKLDAFPDVTNIQVAVNTEAPGLAAGEVEQLITFPIESVMYALPGVSEVRSISKTGISIVTVVFEEGTDIYFARQLVFERLQQAKALIPDGVGLPEIGPNTSGLGNIYSYLLLAEPDSGFTAMSLRSLNDWVVKLLLMPVEGVTEILSFGGEVRQYQVNVNPAALLSYKLTLEEVAARIEQNNRNAGGWYMDRGQEQLSVRGVGWVASGESGLEDIRNIPVKEKDGVIVRVNDIATVEFGAETRQGAVTMARRTQTGDIESLGEVVSGVVLKRMGANTKTTIDGIETRLPLIQQALPEGVTFEPFYNQSQLISQAIETVVNALLIAFVLIVVIIALFLMNLRATMLVLISIPLSIGLALLLMVYWGLSANLMSLGGLAVAIGMLVDGSVVMVENIVKHLNRVKAGEQETSNINSLIKAAGGEVARPTFFAAMIILVVFAPIFSFEGVEAKLFQPMAVSIMLAVVASVLVALFVVPALASLVFKHGLESKPSPVLQPIERLYQKSLTSVLSNKTPVLCLAVALFLGALVVVPKIGTEFVPELEEGTINLRATLAPSANLETSLGVAQQLERKLLEFPEVNWAFSRIGRAEIGGDPEPVNNIEIYMGLKPVGEWVSAESRIELQKLMEQKLSIHPGLLLNFSQPIATRVDELLSGVKAQLAIKLFGPDLAVLAEKGKVIEDIVNTVPGAVDVAMEQLEGEAQLVVRPNRQRLSRYGMSVGDVMGLVEKGIGGSAVGQVIQGNERYDIYLRFDKRSRSSLESISNIRLQSAEGAWLRLKDVASVAIESGPPQVRRDDVQRRVVIQANVQDRDMGSVVADIDAAIKASADLPSGYSVTIGGQFESQQRAQKRLAVVVPLSIAFIAVLLSIVFRSVAQSLLILVNVPLAMIGGIFSLYLGGQYLSVPSSVGFITLFGVAVLNGVVLVESINQRVRAGASLQESVYDGACSRLRPVLMTALTSALGLIPMLLATDTGAEIQKPLATVIVGGIVSATLLTLFVLPVLYPYFSRSLVSQLKRDEPVGMLKAGAT